MMNEEIKTSTTVATESHKTVVLYFDTNTQATEIAMSKILIINVINKVLLETSISKPPYIFYMIILSHK